MSSMLPISSTTDHAPSIVGEDMWLSLHEASALLGISLSTLRRWADAGKVPVYRTVGGHRRFQRQEIVALQAQERGQASSLSMQQPMSLPATGYGSATGQGLEQLERVNQQEWHRKVSARPAADRMRGLGQRLLGLLIQHVHSRSQESRFLAEASAVGTTYGTEAFDAAISLHDTVKAFLFFRRACSQLTAPAAGIAHPVDLTEVAKLQEQIDAFMDAVLLGVLAGYEQQQSYRGGSAIATISEDWLP